MRLSGSLSTLALVLSSLPVLALPAAADDMAFFMRNETSGAIVVELRSTTREMVWPGNDQVYLLDKGERKSVPITCEAGETICYGAWRNGDAGTFWGIGPESDQKCEDCCSVCVAKTTTTITIAD